MLVSLLVAVFASAVSTELPDEVPLIAPVPPVAPPAPASVHVVDPAIELARLAKIKAVYERRLHFGGLVHGTFKSGLQSFGVGAHLEIGYRLPFSHARIGFIATPGIHGLFGGNATVNATSLWVSIPIGLSVHQQLGPGLFRLRAAPALHYVGSSSYRGSALDQDDRYFSFGAEAGVAYLPMVGKGAVLIELGYSLLPMKVAGASELNHVVSLGVGYSFFAL